MEKVFYVDLGSHEGKTIEKWLLEHPTSVVLGFEPDPVLNKNLISKFSQNPNVIIYAGAAGIRSSVANFYQGIRSSESSTLVLGKDPNHPYPVDYSSSQKVKVYNTAKEILSHYKPDYFDLCVMKIDVEGFEYTLVPYLVEKKIISLFDEIRIEWHYHKYGMSKETHDEVYKCLYSQCERILNWK
jgi:FkbM family methyltransferase